MSPTLFALVIFQIRSCFYAWADLDLDLPIYAFFLSGMTGIHLHTQLLLVKMGSNKLFALAGLELQSSPSVS
jgi:hypothetical protein